MATLTKAFPSSIVESAFCWGSHWVETSHPNHVFKHLEKQVLSKPLDGSVLHMEECWTARQEQELMGHSPSTDSRIVCSPLSRWTLWFHSGRGLFSTEWIYYISWTNLDQTCPLVLLVGGRKAHWTPKWVRGPHWKTPGSLGYVIIIITLTWALTWHLISVSATCWGSSVWHMQLWRRPDQVCSLRSLISVRITLQL